jgi:hypothetical protein
VFLKRRIDSPPTGGSLLLWPVDSSLTAYPILASVPSHLKEGKRREEKKQEE